MSKARETASQTLGVAKQPVPIASGDVGILDTLKKEHSEVSMLMKRVSRTRDNESGARVRRDVFPTLRAELLSHARAEERTLYAELKRHNLSRDPALRSIAEHRTFEDILARLLYLDVLDPRWLARFQDLENLVERHIEEEERELFERAKQVLPEDQLRDLDKSFKKEKHDELDQLRTLTAAE